MHADAAPERLGESPERRFFAALAEGRFELQHCPACARGVFYPRTHCPRCGGDSLEWREASGRGAVYATSVVRRRPEQGPPYNVALIDLAEGPRMMSRVEGVAPEAVRIGMAVTASVDRSGETPMVVFRPADAGA